MTPALPHSSTDPWGTAKIDTIPIDKYTMDLLHHMKSKVTITKNPDHPLDPDVLVQRFRKWPEQKSTSPSGWHLGIYKSLAKNFPPQKHGWTNCPRQHWPQTKWQWHFKAVDNNDDPCHQTYTYVQPMETIWTLLLEKDAGNPQIDRLQTIHLYEADYNLMLKLFLSQGFIVCSKHAHWITNNQVGSRSKRCTMDLAITKVLSYKIADTMHMRIIVIENDATVCFD